MITRSLSPVNRHHAREPATGFATPSFLDRSAYFRDKVVSRLWYGYDLSQLVADPRGRQSKHEAHKGARERAREGACRGQDAEQITLKEDFCILICRTQIVWW